MVTVDERHGEGAAAVETIVRTARLEEHRAVARLLVRAHQEVAIFLSPRSFEDYLDQLTDLDRGRGTMLVAEQDGRLVGTVTFHRHGHRSGERWPRGTASLRALGVDPPARQRGVGRLLVAECIARARAVGARGLGAHTADFLYAANSLLASLTFTPNPAWNLETPFENGAVEPLLPKALHLELR